MNDNNHITYTTSDELDYLVHIGTYNHSTQLSRRELLENYLAAMSFRPASEKYLDFKLLREAVERLISSEANDDL